MEDFDVIQAINDVALEVRNFKKHRSRQQWEWSCDVCGDSKVNRTKARFGVTKKQGVWVCNCFNCGYSNTLSSYLKHFHPNQYERLTVNTFNNNIPQMYDLNYLVEGAVENSKLIHLFYINKFQSGWQWLDKIEHKKIKLKETNLRKLYQMHKDYWYEKRNLV